MSYVDEDLARFMHAFDPEPVRAQRREREAVRRNLVRLAVFCAVVLAVVLLAACGPGDATIAGAPVSGEPGRVPEVRAATVSKPVLVDGDVFHNVTTTTTTTSTTLPPTTTTTTVAPTTTAAPRATSPAPTSRAGDPYNIDTWHTLRQCEAPDWSGGWQANTGNGFYGGLQFTLSSWQWVGGAGYPHQASVAEQIRRGQMLWERQGWGAWPACSRKLGWR